MKKAKFDIKKIATVPRRWRYLPTLDWYVFREFIVKFSILVLVFIILFLLGDVLNCLSDFLGSGAPMSQIVLFFSLKMPGNIRFVLPIAVLLGCMWTMAMFGKNSEVTAMRASGISLGRCGLTIFIFGVLVSLTNLWFNEQLVPYTERQAYEILESKGIGDEASRKNNLQRLITYRSPDRARMWWFSTFDDIDQHQNVLLKKFRPDNTLEWDLLAKNARYNDEIKQWEFFGAILTPYSDDGILALSPRGYTFYRLTEKEVPETPLDVLNSIKDKEELPIWVIYRIIQRNSKMSPAIRAEYETAFFYRLAFPWASFIAVFLGIPLATKNERSGVMLAIVSAVGVIVAYVVISQLFVTLGNNRLLPPVVAGVFPTIAFIIYSWYNVAKNRI
ncbi:MAG: LptF/LptG family permease [Lentisphaeria bacterium]|nr:LptF/LptG family permease [Lentisphaeria bacterium]